MGSDTFRNFGAGDRSPQPGGGADAPPPVQAYLSCHKTKEPEREAVARPPSCKHLPVDLADSSEPARERLCALELIDRMVAGGMRRGDALRAAGLAKSTYYDWRRAHPRRAAPARAESGPGSGPNGTAAWSKPSATTAADLGPGVRPSTPSSAATPASH